MNETRGPGLHTIFAFFLGLMVTAFVGVGVYTFYPSPDAAVRDRMIELNRREQAIRNAKAPDALSADDRARLQAIDDERARVEDATRSASQAWGRRTSMVLIAFATLAMAISLLRAMQLPVLSNGLLLGGLFTMIYGVGWSIVTDSSTMRFFVLTVALAITLALGYVRFVRRVVPVSVSVAGDVPVPLEGLATLEARVRSLEDRLAGVVSALTPTGEPGKRS